MKQKNLIYILLIVLIGGGAIWAYNQQSGSGLMRGDETIKQEEMMVGDEAREEMMAENGYQNYDEKSFTAAKDKKRVLFFYAAWCPTCRPADKEISERKEEIPAGVTVFRVNYDTETELKEKYGITYQHTFVLVDENGIELKKWNGGSIDEIIEKTK